MYIEQCIYTSCISLHWLVTPLVCSNPSCMQATTSGYVAQTSGEKVVLRMGGATEGAEDRQWEGKCIARQPDQGSKPSSIDTHTRHIAIHPEAPCNVHVLKLMVIHCIGKSDIMLTWIWLTLQGFSVRAMVMHST